MFTCVSMLILCFYCTKVCCRVPAKLQRQLTFEQKGSLALISLLFLFNDPWYPVHIYSPSFLTFAGTEMTNALFVAGLLIYWLRELAGYRMSRENAKNMGCCKKMAFNCQGVSSCAIVYLCLLFLGLVINFMILNCFYYIYVQGDPSVAGRFSIHNDATMDVFIVPVVITLGLIALYYVQYFFAMLLGCSRLF